MGSVGDCYDNVMAESFFATLETELIDWQPGIRFADRAQAKSMIFDNLEGFYNTKRLNSALGYLSLVEFERRHERAR
ncbi:MAG: transposase [Gammaproteobacteria bacterium]|nr:transposase [Gammaproteobacteria bacterium]MYD81413.1 transposase [Gammaproteobacteria bacterium]